MTNNTKTHSRFLIITLVCLLIISVPITPHAKEQEQTGEAAGQETKEVVILLDASGSMNENDPEGRVADGIAQFVYSLPQKCRAGFVAYNTEVCTVQELLEDSGRDELVKAAETVEYKGYSNAGAGLKAAMALFSEEDTEKYIILLSDGEIDMPEEEQTDQARSAYVEAAEQAKEKGVKIFITAIGNELESQMHIFDGAELTGGAVYWENQSSSLSLLMEKIIAERLSIPRQTLGVTDAGGGNIHSKIPENAGRVKIILTSDTALSEVKADYSASEGRVITGRNFAIADLERRTGNMQTCIFRQRTSQG